jgi:hypothetical protein
MTPEQARRNNTLQVAKIEQSIRQLGSQIIMRALPAALDDIGEQAVAHAKATHTYQNRTGALERSTTHAVIPPRSTGTVFYDSPNGSESFNVSNPENEVLLVLAAGQKYGLYVELLYGFDVIIQSFIKLRRELTASLALRLQGRRLK